MNSIGVCCVALSAVSAGALLLKAGAGPRVSSTQTPAGACAHRGPIALGTPVTPAERAAVPLATTGQAFISIASSRTVTILDLATGQRTTLPAGLNDPHEVAVSPDGRWGVAADFGDYQGDYNCVSRMDLAGRAFVAKHIVGTGSTEGITATPDGREVWMGFDYAGEVRVIDGTTFATLARLPGFRQPHRMTMTPDGRAVIIDFGCDVVQVADVPGRRLLGPIARAGKRRRSESPARQPRRPGTHAG